MNQAHFKLLKRRLAARGTSPSQLLTKAQAARELSDAGVFDESPPEAIDRVRDELEQLLRDAEAVGGWQSDRASSIAGRVLDQLDAEPEEEPTGDFLPQWRHPDLDDEARFAWLELNLLFDMSRALHWRIEQEEWRERSKRVRWLAKQAESIFDSESPLDAADAWLADPPKVPARLGV